MKRLIRSSTDGASNFRMLRASFNNLTHNHSVGSLNNSYLFVQYSVAEMSGVYASWDKYLSDNCILASTTSPLISKLVGAEGLEWVEGGEKSFDFPRSGYPRFTSVPNVEKKRFESKYHPIGNIRQSAVGTVG